MTKNVMRKRQSITKDVTRKIGTYDFQGSVDITDPCYNRAVWCRINDVKIAKGEYLCAIREKDEEEWGVRVSSIGIYNLREPVPAPNTMRRIGNIGVDAGLAGFFHNKKDFSDEEWERLVEDTNPSDGPYKNAWILYDGFFSDSGFGDGAYDVFAYNNSKGEITALEIRFID